ncbi:YrdB family protein [Paenibacillus silviterrae]|uniref:YrdB family protein n=1 Tax=Paenibacillus silviterrae TaxID=3242194 RepID=UPI002543EEBA|nr:YrdB family protein [Paenibacillus chinjuensis]
MIPLHYTNLALRFLLELCALAALGYWGFHTGQSSLLRWGLGLGSPLAVAVLWAMLGSPNAAYPLHGGLHLLLELAVFGSGAVALYLVGQHRLALLYGAAVLINRLLMHLWGQ